MQQLNLIFQPSSRVEIASLAASLGHPPITYKKAYSLLSELNKLYHEGIIKNDKSLEMVVSANESGLTTEFFNYDWTERKREGNRPIIQDIQLEFTSTGDKTTQIKSAYQVMHRVLIENKYFIEENAIEEKNAAGLLLQPLVANASGINLLVNNFIARLKKINDSSLEPPRIDGSNQSYINWLLEYHQVNNRPLIKGVPVPEYLNGQNNKQLSDMFYGINDPKRIERRLREKQFVVEFYKAQKALLPEGFDRWGHKQIGLLYDKLNRWYVKDKPQGSLFIE